MTVCWARFVMPARRSAPTSSRPDSPEAAELLAKILSMDASADTVRTDGSPIHATAAPYLETTSVEPHKRGARVWSRRSPLLWISIAAAILIAAVAVPLTISRNSRPPVSVASTWRLTDATSQPGWALPTDHRLGSRQTLVPFNDDVLCRGSFRAHVQRHSNDLASSGGRSHA